jgi:hypothetical protein
MAMFKPVQYADSLLKKNRDFIMAPAMLVMNGSSNKRSYIYSMVCLIGMSVHDNRFFIDDYECSSFSCFATMDDAHIKKYLDLMVCKI